MTSEETKRLKTLGKQLLGPGGKYWNRHDEKACKAAQEYLCLLQQWRKSPQLTTERG